MNPAAPNSGAQSGTPSPHPALAVGKETVESALRRAKAEATPDGAPWSACRAPAHVLVVDNDGFRACAHAGRRLEAPAGDWAAAWNGADLQNLRTALAAGQLPDDHCRGCAHRFAHGPASQTPAVRVYGHLPATVAGATPDRIVLRLPADGEPPEAMLASLTGPLPNLTHLDLVAPRAWPESTRLFDLLRTATPGPQLTVAWRGSTTPDLEVLQGLRVVTVEWTTSTTDRDALATFRAACERLGAAARIRFVLRPENWFWFEDTVLAASAAGLTAEWHVLDDDGDEPLAHVPTDELTLVKNVVANTWQRLGGAQHPAAVGENSIHTLVEELRHLLQRRLESELRGPAAAPARLTLPPFTHPWFVDSVRAHWGWKQRLQHGHMALVHDDLVQQAKAGTLDADAARHPGVRILVQRLAHDHRTPELLQVLRRVFSGDAVARRLAAAEAEFAANHDLRRFGGPWAAALGLEPQPARRRPFGLGKPKKPKEGAAADVTVLVPSYQHGLYIEETLRSVLAQRHANFRLLVVDDGSPDDTVAKARAIVDPRLEVRVNASNLGLGNSVLQALATIDTPYVALLNSDDLFHPDRLARCCKVLDEQPATNLVTTGLHLVDANGGELTPANVSFVRDGHQVYDWVHWFARATPPQPLAADALFPALLERNFLATSSNLVCRTDWLRARADALRSLKYCLDWQLFLDAARENSLHHLPEPLAAYRLHATNTVWFRGGRRWSFYLEVNRVLAQSLRDRVAAVADPEQRMLALLQLVTQHVLPNRESDGVALFVNAVVDMLQADAAAERSPAIQAELQRLNDAALATLALRDATPAQPAAPRQRAALALGEVARELLPLEQSRAERASAYADSLEVRLRDCWDGRNRLEGEKQALLQKERELHQTLQSVRQQADQAQRTLREAHDRLQQELGKARSAHDETSQRLRLANEQEQALRQRAEALAKDLDAVRADLRVVREQATILAEVRDLVQKELTGLRAERDSLQTRFSAATRAADADAKHIAQLDRDLADTKLIRDSLQRDLADTTANRDSLQYDLADTKANRDSLQRDLADTKANRDSLQRDLADTTTNRDSLRQDLTQLQSRFETRTAEALDLGGRLERETAQVRAQQGAIQQLEQQRMTLIDAVHTATEEIKRLNGSREFRIGNFFWNKLYLSNMSRRGKKWYHRILDAKDRFSLWFGNKYGKHTAEGVAVVASCWHWPIYSHTFVYQEMIGLTHMGLDVRMFHWAENDTAQLQPAFAYLGDHRTMIKSVWENHKKDKAHFDETRPGRLRALLERVAPLVGKTVEDLEKEPHVLRACTFARMAELAGARYLHTYFFYDQTFMAMVASWLLEIPRGISCYADHMLDDFPFKLVGLQIELASVIVATSARIKQELSEKSGDRFDDRIIVKPNGVDGARFPSIERKPRHRGDLFEVVSVSRIEPKKGLIHLVEAVASLKAAGHRMRVNVVGVPDPHNKGSLEFAQQLDQRIAELGVQDEVVMHGMKMQEEILPMLQRSNAFVAPYVELATGDKDGIPTAMLEAMAAGLPVVTTNAGSILEVVEHEVEALIVPQRDSAGFAKALERLIEQPSLERKLSKAARARFDRQFDIKVTERVFHARVAQLLAERKANAAS